MTTAGTINSTLRPHIAVMKSPSVPNPSGPSSAYLHTRVEASDEYSVSINLEPLEWMISRVLPSGAPPGVAISDIEKVPVPVSGASLITAQIDGLELQQLTPNSGQVRSRPSQYTAIQRARFAGLWRGHARPHVVGRQRRDEGQQGSCMCLRQEGITYSSSGPTQLPA